MKCANYGLHRSTERDNLNLNPLQRGGVLSAAAREALFEFSDGYSVCDYCGGRLDKVAKPGINNFLDDLAEFINADIVRTINGAREGKFAVMHGICNPGETVVVDGNAHYTTHLAVERNNLNMIEVPVTEEPEFEVTIENYRATLENAVDSENVSLAVLTHVDGEYGNLVDAKKIAKVCHDNDVPLLLNCAYSMGRLPIDANKWGVDFIVGSGHKSMAASGPIGVLGVSDEFADKLLVRSSRHSKKEIELLGCTSRGAPIATLMASLPHLIERVSKWDLEVKKSQNFVSMMEEIDGVTQLGVKPTKHDLVRFDTPIFHKIGKIHKRKGYYLYEELKKRHIVGIKRGQTEWFKCSTYGMTTDQIKYIAEAFKEISEIPTE